MTKSITQPADLERFGPLVDISVGVNKDLADTYTRVGRAIPVSLQLKALIDTGASMSCLKAGIADLLDLNPIRTVPMNTASHSRVVFPVFRIRLLIEEGGVVFENMSVCEIPLADQHVDCLLGRDILRGAIFSYNGPDNCLSLEF